MKILFISMPSIHAIRWIENLKETNNELYWFDVLNKGRLQTIDSVTQFTDWKFRKIPTLKGEYFLYKKAPFLYNLVHSLLEVTANEKLEKIINEIQPDVVHSFEMQNCSYPILKTMKKFNHLNWIYSCWGNDLFFYQNNPIHKFKIKKVLQRVNYLHTDCERDYKLAKELGFNGNFLGVIPGGTGYKINDLIKIRLPFEERKIILVKGYQNTFGRALTIVKALNELQSEMIAYEIIVFGAHNEVVKYLEENQLAYKLFHRHELTHNQLLEWMGKALIYIGNNSSDGMPNTLLEAIIMGAFPIQSNPGGATSEIIVPKKNGLLIKNTEDVEEIKELLKNALLNQKMIKAAMEINLAIAYDKLDYEINKKKVIAIYQNI